jgi:phage-related protein
MSGKENAPIFARSTVRGTLVRNSLKRVPAIFFKTTAGNEPVREWLRSMSSEDRRLIGGDIRTVEYGWPLGMPTCRPLGRGLNEVRSNLPRNRISRVFFYIDQRQRMVLLHAIVKKSRAAPEADLALARKNMAMHERGLP